MTSQRTYWLAVLILVLITISPGWCQVDSENALTRIKVSELLSEKSLSSRTENGTLTFNNLSIYWEGSADGSINNGLKLFLAAREAKGDTIKAIRFLSCTGPSLYFEDFQVGELIFQSSKFRSVSIEKCNLRRLISFESEFASFDVYTSAIETFSFQLESSFKEEKSSVRHMLFMNSNFSFFEIIEPGNVGISLHGCTILSKPGSLDVTNKHDLDSMQKVSSSERCANKRIFEIFNLSNNYLRMHHNTVDQGSIPTSIRIDGNYNLLFVEDNIFDTNVHFNATVASKLVLINNRFNHSISIQGSEFPQTNSLIDWDGICNDKLYIPNLFPVDTIYFHEYYLMYKGNNDEELADRIQYKELINGYQKLLTIFRARGDIEYANKCYAEMKDKQINWLAYTHRQDPNFNSFFRFQLGRLIKFYTNHGTDPARSIVVSVFVILVFGVFYFFFPSDWDTSSKSELIRRYKDLIEKNEKGYVVPLFKLMGGFSLSMANALTLSLNSFVTLGFGNIPTHGLARYICIIEGFIGWFLLSIFTVSLINQVLF